MLGVVALLVAAAAAAAFLLTSSGGEAEETAYQEKVAAVFGPVLGANRDMATELDRLRGTEPTDARSAVRRARQATTRAEGALAALTVPDGAEELAGDARQVLDREKAYLGALSAVLSNPASPNRSQLETLESNLASAFSEAGPTVAGTDEPVNGANRVTAWAPRASRALKRRAAAKDGQGAATSGGTAAPASNPYSNGRACGDGVYAGPNTSCDFAFNVRDAYNEAPGSTASVRAFSPATGETYTMNCAPSGNGITCSGGNSASVTF